MRISIVSVQKTTMANLLNVLVEKPSYKIAWVAFSGAEAIKKSLEDTPDLILMDLAIPSALETVQTIMQKTPCAIVIVTTDVGTNLSLVFEAMGHGAVDVANLSQEASKEQIEDILRKIDTLSRLIGKVNPPTSKIKKNSDKERNDDLPDLVVIGASTGGPLAITKVISKLTKKTNLAIVVIQHVDEYFADKFARWLQNQTELPVSIAKERQKPLAGQILVAGKNQHLVMLESQELKYINDPMERPIDVFFNSVARHWPKKFVGILLTGMGGDGAKGLKVLHDKGWHTIVEDPKSCIVFGMPKEALKLNAVSEVLDPDQIGLRILSLSEERNEG